MTHFAAMNYKSHTKAVVLVVLCAAILVWRLHLVQSGSVEGRTYYASDTRIDSIIYGCLLAVWRNPWQNHPPSKQMSLFQWTIFTAAVGMLFVTFVYRNPAFRETFRYSLQGIALLPIFYFAIRFDDNFLFKHLNSRVIVRLGTYSYSVYLIHFIIVNAILAQAPVGVSNTPVVLFSVALMFSIAYAAAIDCFVDPYFRQLRQQYRCKLT
jgi:peptidoglycan/LPS O-acetylase OafA/YrhL